MSKNSKGGNMRRLNFSKCVADVTTRYSLLAKTHNDGIYASDEYKNFKSPKAAEVQKKADLYLENQEKIRKLQTENEKLGDEVRTACGVGRWWGSEDFTTMSDQFNRNEREKVFKDRFKPAYYNEHDRVQDIVRANLERDIEAQLSVEDLAAAIFAGDDTKLLKQEVALLVAEDDEPDV